MSQHHNFRLYLAGDGELSVRAKANFERLIRSQLGEHCELEIIDILLAPQEARKDRVVATPLLVRTSPEPVVKILGDLSTATTILAHLGIKTAPPSEKDSDTQPG